MSIRGAQTKTWTKIEMDDFQTIQCAKDFLEQLKMSSFYPKDWKYTTCDDFIAELEKYLIWFKNK